jgi:hypothetical protein
MKNLTLTLFLSVAFTEIFTKSDLFGKLQISKLWIFNFVCDLFGDNRYCDFFSTYLA